MHCFMAWRVLTVLSVGQYWMKMGQGERFLSEALIFVYFQDELWSRFMNHYRQLLLQRLSKMMINCTQNL